MNKKPKLTATERDQIAVSLAAGLSLRRIARELQRSVSSISVEVKRNSLNGHYRSITAPIKLLFGFPTLAANQSAHSKTESANEYQELFNGLTRIRCIPK